MQKDVFDKKFYTARDKAADLFDTPEVYQRIVQKIENEENSSILLPTVIARRYAEQLVYSVLKELLVDESDSDLKD